MDFSSWISVSSYWGAATMGFFVAFRGRALGRWARLRGAGLRAPGGGDP